MRPMKRILMPVLFAVMVGLLSGCSDKFIVLDPKGPIGSSQRDLMVIATILCAIVIVPVLIMTVIIVWRYRDKPGRKAAYKPNWEHNNKLEFTWWTIPIIVIIALAAVTVNYTYALEPSKQIESAKEEITIQVTSLDWKWLFKYPDQDIATINYAQIPAGVPVRFELTSESAMNSFWIPQLGGQMYTMSGMAMTLYLQADEEGSYYGSGANFTGKDFAQMTFKVKATSEDEFDAWVKEVKETSPPLTEEAYEQLLEPGVSDLQSFSSFPEGLFERVVTKYAPGGSHHHGGTNSKDREKPDDGANGVMEESQPSEQGDSTSQHHHGG
ncbi:hypothetical protein PAE9249_02897 [Paenibacillus sp. CECT 9249]|nr:hypothetical protein PAE9249_02897 [Paenibacillus sp. CECT 9249]